MNWINEWQTPKEVTDVDIAFPARALEVMPTLEECETFLDLLGDDEVKWRAFQKKWFFEGLPETFQVALREFDGVKVDGEKAFRHLRVIQESFAPKHEHKEAAVACLAALWFEDYSFEGFKVEE